MKTKEQCAKLSRQAIGLFILVFCATLPTLALDPPEIDSIEPRSGVSVGGTFTLTGSNLLTHDAEALHALFTDRHNLKISAPAIGHSEKVYVRVPEDLSPGRISVVLMRRSRDGKVDQTKPIPYFILAAPEIHSIHPAQGARGAFVTIKGKELGRQQNNSYVLFVGELQNGEPRGSVPATVISWTNDKVQVMVPSELAAGPSPADIRLVRMDDPDSNKGMLTAADDQARFLVLPSP